MSRQTVQSTEKETGLFRWEMSRTHIFQSALAGTYILLAFSVSSLLRNGMIVGSLGASTFIAFSFPHAESSRPRYLIGGYCIGALTGIFCNGISANLIRMFPLSNNIHICALAVFMAMLLMTALDFEHPPSAALSIAVSTSAEPVWLALAALVSILILCGLKEALKKHLRNL